MGLRRYLQTLLILTVLLQALTASSVLAETKPTQASPAKTTSVVPQSGVSIVKDKNDNIHVLLKPELLSRVQATQQNGKITLLIPNGADNSVNVDTILQNAKVVDVKSTGQGRQVTIHTDAVYWDVKPETLGSANASNIKPVANTQAKPNAQAQKNKNLKTAKAPAAKNILKTTAQKPIKKPIQQKAVPNKKPQPISQLTKKQGHLATKPKAAFIEETEPQAPTDSQQAVNREASFIQVPNDSGALSQSSPKKIALPKSSPKAPLETKKPSDSEEDWLSSQDKTVEETDRLTWSDQRAVDAGDKTIDNQETTASDAEISTAAADDEATLLNWNEDIQQNKKPFGLAIPELLRIGGSLFLVLGLLFGFMKWVLPQLLEKGFFQKRDHDSVPVLQQNKVQKPKRAKNRLQEDAFFEPYHQPPQSQRNSSAALKSSDRLSGLSALRRASDPAPSQQRPQPNHVQPNQKSASMPPLAADIPNTQTGWQAPSERYANPSPNWASRAARYTGQDANQAVNQQYAANQEAYQRGQQGQSQRQPNVSPSQAYPSQVPQPHISPSQISQAPAGYEHPLANQQQVPSQENSAAGLTRRNTGLNRSSLAADSPQRAFIERLGQEEEGFQIINSTRIDKNKELHLIEIRGRQLVLATTPYSVSLVTELAGADLIPSENSAAFLADTARNVNDSQDIYKKYLSSERAQDRQQTYQSYANDKRYTDPAEVVVLDDYDDVFRR